MAEIVVKLVNGELAGKTAQSIAKEVNAAANALKKAEVGTKQWVEANKKLDDAKALHADLKKQIEGTAEASDMLKAAWNNLPGAQFFNQIGDSLGMAKKGVGGLVTQMGVLKTAIISTGVGALVVLIGSLVTWFQKTEEGADKLKGALYPLQVLFSKLTGIVSELGGKVFARLEKAFEDPIGAIKELGQAIMDNIIKRFESLSKFGPAIAKIFNGEIMEGFKDLGNAAIQLGTGVENGIEKMMSAGEAIAEIWTEAYKQGQLLLELENAIEDAEIALTTSRARLNVEMAKAGEIARNTLLTDETRLEAARRYQQLQSTATAQEENLLRLKLQRLKLEQDIDGILGDDERLERAKLEADLIQLQADNIDKNKKARALELGLIEEIAKREIEIAKNIADLKVQAMEEGIDKEIAAIELSTQEKIDAIIGSETQIAEQELLLLEIKEQQIQAVKDKYAAEAAAKDQKAKDDQKKRDDQAAKEKEALARQQAEFAREMADMEIGIAQDSLGFAGEVAAKATKNAQEAKKIQKTFTLADIGINLQKELSANAVAAAANPLNATTFGAAGTAQLAKSNLVSIVRAGIASARVIAFRKGGIPSGVLRGPSHEAGGIPLVAEGDEIILTKGVFRNPYLRKMASDINVAGGGVSFFATGGVPMNPIQSQPATGSQAAAAAGVLDPSSAISEMKVWIAAMVEAVDRRIDRIEVVNNVGDTAEGIRTLNEIQESADV